MKSISDLKALIAAKDAEVGVVDGDYQRLNNPSWKASPEGLKWRRDWSAFRDNYNGARDEAEKAITAATASFMPDAINPADREYARIVQAVQGHPGVLKEFNGIQEGIVIDGGFQDLFLRLAPARSIVDAQTRGAADKAQAAAKVKAAADAPPLQSWKSAASQWQPQPKVLAEIPVAKETIMIPPKVIVGGGIAAAAVIGALIYASSVKSKTDVRQTVLPSLISPA